MRCEVDAVKIRELQVVVGYLSGVLAYAALDLGDPDGAMTHTRVAWRCAELTGNDDLRAWVRGTQSLILRFQERYAEALEYARDGLRYAHNGPTEARLHSGEAHTLAHFDHRPDVYRALGAAEDALQHDSDTQSSYGGPFDFPIAKHRYYIGSSLIWLTDKTAAKDAETASQQAIERFEVCPPHHRSESDERLAHIYLATARAHLHEPDGVRQALEPILALPPSERISWQRKRIRRVADLLDHGVCQFIGVSGSA